MDTAILARHRMLVLAILAGPAFWLIVATVAPRLSAIQQPLLTLWLILQFCLIYPILEELVFRGGVQGFLRKHPWGRRCRLGISSANLVTSLLFSAMHLWSQPWGWALAVMVPSLLFGYLRERYQGLTAPMLLHSYYNSGYMLFVISA